MSKATQKEASKMTLKHVRTWSSKENGNLKVKFHRKKKIYTNIFIKVDFTLERQFSLFVVYFLLSIASKP